MQEVKDVSQPLLGKVSPVRGLDGLMLREKVSQMQGKVLLSGLRSRRVRCHRSERRVPPLCRIDREKGWLITLVVLQEHPGTLLQSLLLHREILCEKRVVLPVPRPLSQFGSVSTVHELLKSAAIKQDMINARRQGIFGSRAARR